MKKSLFLALSFVVGSSPIFASQNPNNNQGWVTAAIAVGTALAGAALGSGVTHYINTQNTEKKLSIITARDKHYALTNDLPKKYEDLYEITPQKKPASSYIFRVISQNPHLNQLPKDVKQLSEQNAHMVIRQSEWESYNIDPKNIEDGKKLHTRLFAWNQLIEKEKPFYQADTELQNYKKQHKYVRLFDIAKNSLHHDLPAKSFNDRFKTELIENFGSGEYKLVSVVEEMDRNYTKFDNLCKTLKDTAYEHKEMIDECIKNRDYFEYVRKQLKQDDAYKEQVKSQNHAKEIAEERRLRAKEDADRAERKRLEIELKKRNYELEIRQQEAKNVNLSFINAGLAVKIENLVKEKQNLTNDLNYERGRAQSSSQEINRLQQKINNYSKWNEKAKKLVATPLPFNPEVVPQTWLMQLRNALDQKEYIEPQVTIVNPNQQEEVVECSICLEEIEPQTMFSTTCKHQSGSTAKHIFHKECIKGHKASQQSRGIQITCPICRGSIQNLHELQ